MSESSKDDYLSKLIFSDKLVTFQPDDELLDLVKKFKEEYAKAYKEQRFFLDRMWQQPEMNSTHEGDIRGWRQYSITEEGYLVGAYSGTWFSGEMHAECLRSGNRWDNVTRPNRENPEAQKECAKHLLANRCRCGIYILKERGNNNYVYTMPITAGVQGWGAFIEAERGYRVEYARLVSLFVPKYYVLDHMDTDIETITTVLEARYRCRVVVQAKPCERCGTTEHDPDYEWTDGEGRAWKLCAMTNAHVYRVLRYLKGLSPNYPIRSRAQRRVYDIRAMERELERRQTRRNKDGRFIVKF